MIFSSASFLFAFLPCVAIVYYLLRSRTARNVFLTLVSLFFYAWGEPWFVLVMLLSIVINWFIALRIGAGEHKKAWLVVGLVCDLGLLAVFKYLGFLMENVNWIFHLSLPVPQIVLPIGISFFTFQAISYIIDVYRGDGRVQKSLMNVCLYISFFPQLIAGPIVRYQTFDDQITTRRETLDDFCEGIRRFIVGLAKKVLLANNLAALADTAFAMQTTELSLVGTWLAAASYMLQLYFDFSGYSDMAIGLARMFGFHLLENFNLPFIARSIAGFWKRWHISLTSWFRDYLYFPLGGSRVSKGRLLFNMGVVWVLTGFWHGAQWTYLVWGFLFFVLQAFERFSGAGKWLEKHRIGHLYVFLVVMIASVVSRADSIPHALDLYRSMFGLDGSAIFDDTARMFLREYGAFLVAGVLCCLPVPKRIPDAVRGVGLAAAGFVAITYVVMGSYNPFIYFNF
ncbi:MAG TPA: MBOAT family protein [Candidatus Ornithocaccomicrobium faecavium]|uniref:MBOAT family protein n=1 Tax=Candidatus Ornithocaccomicrobium faecavium TaxID=2840890 RepID=A0A9D1TDM7_9FIRM|nr:MBOAT family protein [Candidatus Ornithocaccomicrobium faecavium]